jgi:hypothetical protein
MTWFWGVQLILLLLVVVVVNVLAAPPRRKVAQPPLGAPIRPVPPPSEKPRQAGLILPVASWPTTWVEEIVAHNGLAVDPYEFWRDKYAQTGNPTDLAQMLRFVTRNP